MKNIQRLSIAASVVAIAACDGGSVGGESGTRATAQLPEEMRGRWTSQCHTRDDIAPEYVVETLVLSGDTMVQEKRFYEDAGCTVAVDAETGHYYNCEWDLGVQASAVRTASGDAMAIDLSIRSATLDGKTVETLVGATEFNIVQMANGALRLGDNRGDLDGIDSASRPQTLYSQEYYPG